MAVRTEIKVTCDVCDSQMSPVNKDEKTEISVIQTTEQTEGRSCSPYLQTRKIDICNKCLEIILRGNMLFSHGAQGYNKYYFKE